MLQLPSLALPIASLLLASAAALPAGARELDANARGELLLGELGCSACHAATPAVEARLQTKRAPNLDDIGRRASPAWIRRYLLDPQATKPGATMPHVLAGVPRAERGAVTAALTHHLIATTGGFEDQGTGARASGLEEGRRLYHEVGCIACHAPQEAEWKLGYGFEEARAMDDEPDDEAQPDDGPPLVEVPLGDLARKWSVASLAAFLMDPLATRPSGRMPSLSLDEDEARAIALYLLRDQAFGANSGPERFPGLAYDYYEERFNDAAPDYAAHVPVRGGVVESFAELPEHRDDQFGFRFMGSVRVDTEGEYTFYTTSDDGSRLYVDGELVVNNDGNHAPREREGTLELDAGWHALEVTMFENSGGEMLKVEWEGPGLSKSALPADRLSHTALAYHTIGAMPVLVDEAKAAEGARQFQSLSCWSCHQSEVPGLAPAATPRPPKNLAQLDIDATVGCLADVPGPNAPRYTLSDEDRAALKSVLANPAALAGEQAPTDQLELALERMRCSACHSRGGEGGPAYERRPYFRETGHWDLGDQGRIPPHLDEPGSKLTPHWLAEVLFDGGTSRDYVATRMPQFGRENLAALPALFREVDAKPDDLTTPDFDLAEVEHGQRLAGKNGLGCIQCHEFAGYPSLGIPAVDLAYVRDRIQPGWFRRLLRDPVSINMNSRMPEFWVQGKSPVADVHGGDIDKQVDALWTYLSLGPSMPLPEGLVVPDEAFELIVGDEPRTVGVFMKDVSPRTLCVGFPVGTHYAYDMQDARLAKVWRGRFFNARGTWEGRAGVLELPPSEDVLDLPDRPSLARLASREDEWPSTNTEQAGFRVLGRRFFEFGRVPIFRYELGDLVIEERIEPELREGGSWMRRMYTIYSDEPVEDLYLRPREDEHQASEDPGEYWDEDGELRLGRDIVVMDLTWSLEGGYQFVSVHVQTSLWTTRWGGLERAPREDGLVLQRVTFTPTRDGRFIARIGEEFTW